MSVPNKSAVTRRDVVKIASASLGTAALTGVGPSAATAAPAHWDMETDVLILGYGGAGACAAIEAHDAGSKVLILEKQAQASHVSNTRMAAGAVYAADPTGDAAALKQYAEAIQSGDNLPWMLEGEQADLADAIAAAWAKYEPQNIAFLQSLDPDFKTMPSGPAGFSNFPGQAAAKDRSFFSTYTGKVDFMNPTKDLPKNQKMMGEALWACMATGVSKRKNIRVLYETPAKDLLTNEKGEITGATAEQKGKTIRIKARRAVIIATGGYEFDKTMRAAFLDGPGGEGWSFYGTPANTGDGIRMALRAGAGLLKARVASGGLLPALPIRFNGLRIGTGIGCIGTPNSLVVNNAGKRFFDESESSSATYFYYQEALKFDIKTTNYPNIPSWLIFDETLRKRAPMVSMAFGTVGYGIVPWSADNLDAVNRGWILKADSFDELKRTTAS